MSQIWIQAAILDSLRNIIVIYYWCIESNAKANVCAVIEYFLDETTIPLLLCLIKLMISNLWKLQPEVLESTPVKYKICFGSEFVSQNLLWVIWAIVWSDDYPNVWVILEIISVGDVWTRKQSNLYSTIYATVQS